MKINGTEKNYCAKTDDETGTNTGTGGSAGEILFHYADLVAQRRDDLLPPSEIERLLLVACERHKAMTDNQKRLLKDREDIKNKKKPLHSYSYGQEQGYGYGQANHHQSHPVLAKEPQFAGAPRQISTAPEYNEAQTNKDNQIKNNLELEPRARPENAPSLLPRPSPFNR